MLDWSMQCKQESWQASLLANDNRKILGVIYLHNSDGLVYISEDYHLQACKINNLMCLYVAVQRCLKERIFRHVHWSVLYPRPVLPCTVRGGLLITRSHSTQECWSARTLTLNPAAQVPMIMFIHVYLHVLHYLCPASVIGTRRQN